MRILFRGTDHPSAISKSIRKSLASREVFAGARACEEAFARMAGYANWHELRTVCLRSPEPSPRDDEAGPSVAAARRSQYVRVLTALEVDDMTPAIAAAVVDEVRPTGRRGRRPAPAVPSGPLTESELLALVAGYQLSDLTVRQPEVARRLAADAPGRTYDPATLASIMGRHVLANLASAGLLKGALPAPRRVADGRDEDLETYVRNPGLTDEEFQADLDAGDEARRGLRDLERDLVRAEEAVADFEERGDDASAARALEAHSRIGELVTVAEWAEDEEEAGED